MPSVVPERGPGPPNPATPTTIDVIYEHLSDVAEHQIGDQANLDGKMVQVFTAASVVMGLTGLSATTATSSPTAVAFLLVLALAAYAVVAILTGFALWARGFWTLRFGSSLWEKEWDVPPEQVKLAVITEVKPAYDKNLGILTQKAHLLSAGIIATGVEVALVAAAVIVRVVS